MRYKIKKDAGSPPAEALHHSEERYRSLFENMSEGLAHCRVLFEEGAPEDFVYVDVNNVFEKLMRVKNVAGRRVSEVTPAIRESQPELFRGCIRVATTGQAERIEICLEAFKEWFLVSLHSLGPGCFMAEFENITERKQAMEDLRKSEEKFRSIFENAPVGIFQATAARLVTANPAMAKMFGYQSLAEMLRSRPSPESYFVHPEQRKRIVAEAQEAGTYVQRKVEYRRKDGSIFMGNLRVRVYCDEAGKIRTSEGFIEDVNAREQAEGELLKATEQLRQSQKMEALGQLAAGVAHDFNNALLTIRMSLGKLWQTPSLSVETMESFNEIEKTTARAKSLTRQLLTFSREHAARIEAFDMNVLISDQLAMLRRLLGEQIEITFQFPPAPVRVNADAGMMEQVVMNLCINARDAMPTGGRLTLTAAAIEVQSSTRVGSHVCLSVSDTGCGMDETVLRRIFEPFFTTKEVGRGTGLGLATVHRIVKQHQGWVEVESAVGRGSSFRVYLPQTSPIAAAATSSQDEEIGGGTESILLVEDDLSVRRMVAAQLRQLGYTVREAGDGLEALKIWEQHRQEIELLFTDMAMPGNLTGMDLALRLQKEQPSLKVISSSGYSAIPAKGALTAVKEIVHLPKPYDPAALAMTVRRCLDTTSASAAQNVFRCSP